MKKSLIFILIALLCLFTSCDLELRKSDGGSMFDEIVNEEGFNKGSGTADDPYVIKDASQFTSHFSTDTYTEEGSTERIYLRLASDIVLDGSIEYFLNNVELDGDGHMLSVDGPYPDDPEKPYRDAGVFRRVDNSTIKNLVFQYDYKALIGVAARGDIVLENVSVVSKTDEPVKMYKNNGLFVTYGWGIRGTSTENDSLTFINCTNYVNTVDSDNSSYYGIFIGNTASAYYKQYVFESCRNLGNHSSAGRIGVMIGNVYSKPHSNTQIIVKDFVNEGNITSTQYASLLTMYEDVNELAKGSDTIINNGKITILPDPEMSLAAAGKNTYIVNLGSLNKDDVYAVILQGVVSLVYFNSDGTYAKIHDVNFLRELSYTEDSSSGSFTVTVPTSQIIGSHDKDQIASVNESTGIATLKDETIAVYFENPSYLVCTNTSDSDPNSPVIHKNGTAIGGFDRFHLIAYGKSGEILGSTTISKADNGYPAVKN